jgi:hypothetical protein
MSGGFFNYDQARIRNMIDSIEELIKNNGRAKTEEEIRYAAWCTFDDDYFDKHPLVECHRYQKLIQVRILS